jgi:ankyrin repeat protein
MDLWIAVNQNQRQTVEKMLREGGDVNFANPNCGDATLLWTAAYKGYDDMVTVLIDAGAIVNQCTSDCGTTPLYVAVQQGHSACVQRLIDADADLNQSRTDNGATPLWATAIANNHIVAKMLINAGADVNQKNNDGICPLQIAVQRRHDATVQVLVQSGANLNQSNNSGFTPVQLAALHGYSSTLRLLVNAGAETNIDQMNVSTTSHLPLDPLSVVNTLLFTNAGVLHRNTPMHCHVHDNAVVLPMSYFLCVAPETFPQCVICLCDFVMGDEVCRLPCPHLFHKECGEMWFSVNPLCPLCKTHFHRRIDNEASVQAHLATI